MKYGCLYICMYGNNRDKGVRNNDNGMMILRDSNDGGHYGINIFISTCSCNDGELMLIIRTYC